MSVLLKTDLTEYARQCTLQRRRYEECQEAQHSDMTQGDMTQATAASACSVDQFDVDVQIGTSAFNEGAEQVTHGSLADLLGLSAEPCAWDDQQATPPEANHGATGAQQWYSDRAPLTQQHASAAPKNVSSVSYGAP